MKITLYCPKSRFNHTQCIVKDEDGKSIGYIWGVLFSRPLPPRGLIRIDITQEDSLELDEASDLVGYMIVYQLNEEEKRFTDMDGKTHTSRIKLTDKCEPLMVTIPCTIDIRHYDLEKYIEVRKDIGNLRFV